ncbi:MAG: coproporphyrinogen oxidase [Deltaproteobacteria bacterium]|nr:coproporphyrinogen oxidase [Deltaproteobacteria bacterium]
MSERPLRYEIGPIRPPNEAYSLLVRFTRNCSWNKCLFCQTYKGKRFEKRSLAEITSDIDSIKAIRDDIKELSWKKGFGGKVTDSLVEDVFDSHIINEGYKSVAVWMYFGCKNVFIQDANSLAMKADVFIDALKYLKEIFPTIDRVTCYARARTIARSVSPDNLKRMKEAGLTRLHVGLESGNDALLQYMNKGATRDDHILCGRKVKDAGIELSEYVVLGLGGKKWWREHALDTADVLNKIDPDFIRFRTLKVLRTMLLYQKLEDEEFFLPDEEDILREERLLIENLDGITSYVRSDHILNLLEEIDGRLPFDKKKFLSTIDRYFSLSEEQRLVFRFGRRSGIYRRLDELSDELTSFRIKKSIREMEEKEPGSVERAISLLLENYI